jgi:hypothetical protein
MRRPPTECKLQKARRLGRRANERPGVGSSDELGGRDSERWTGVKVVRSPIQHSARGLLADATPLFKEERDFLSIALSQNLLHPVCVHGSRSRPGFPADNDPLNSAELKTVKWTEKRLTGEKSHGCWNMKQVPDSMEVISILDTHTHPNILWPRKLGRDGSQTFAALGENLKLMTRYCDHYLKNFLDVLERYAFVKQVAHGVHENLPGTFPAEWIVQCVGL